MTLNWINTRGWMDGMNCIQLNHIKFSSKTTSLHTYLVYHCFRLVKGEQEAAFSQGVETGCCVHDPLTCRPEKFSVMLQTADRQLLGALN